MAANPRAVHSSIKPGSRVRSACKLCPHSCMNLMHVMEEGIINTAGVFDGSIMNFRP